MTVPKQSYSRRSLLIYAGIFAACILLSIPLARSWRSFYGTEFLKAAGELQPVESIVENQQKRQALYGSALFEDDFQYKLDLLRARRPDVIALGSSRALQFREEFFSVPFISAGRAMNSIPQGAQFVDAMLKVHRPKVVILTLDVWWLNPRRREPPMPRRALSPTSPLISAFWSYVNDRKLTTLKTLRVILGDDSNPVSLRHAIGIQGLVRGQGFRPDGSRDYGSRYFGTDPTFDDRNFANSRSLVRNGQSLLSFGQTIDQDSFATLNQLVTKLKDAGIAVIAVLPPFAPTVLGLIEQQKKDYAYIPLARAAYQSLPIKVFDFLQSQSLDNSECEFADGLHAGDITYQRMLLRMTEMDPAGPLASFVRQNDVAAAIRLFSGHAVTPTAADGYRYPEIDFLGIGCDKGASVSATSR
jgi:hypothetical protein